MAGRNGPKRWGRNWPRRRKLPQAAETAPGGEGGQPDDGSRYYEYWLAALERLVKAKGLLDSGTLRLRRDEWERAYRATPHGKPVLLSAAGKAPTPSAGTPRPAERRD